MKKRNFLILITIVSMFLFSGCGSGDGSSDSQAPTVVVVTTGVEEEEKPPTPPSDEEEIIIDATTDTAPEIEKKFLVRTESGLYFSDGVDLEYWQPPGTKKAGPGYFIAGDQLIKVDASGDIVATETMNHSPAAALVGDQDFYSCTVMTPAESLKAGARFTEYTTIYKNSVIISEWYWNEFGCDRIIKSGDSTFLIDAFGGYHVIDGPAENVVHISDDFYIHDRSTTWNTIKFNDYVENYETNYILAAKQWQLFDEVYYSENGFTWSELYGLAEGATALDGFKLYPYPIDPQLISGERPALLAAGESDDHLYIIECASGYLFEYSPENDTLEQKYRLYIGDGIHLSGSQKIETLKPLIIDNILYYSNDGSVNRIDLATGVMGVFFAGSGEVMRYD